MPAYKGSAYNGAAHIPTAQGASVASEAALKLLLHCNGTDDSVILTDTSLYGKIATLVGNARIKTDQSVFGGSSLYFDGTGDYVEYALADKDFIVLADDFVIEFRMRPGAATQGQLFQLASAVFVSNGDLSIGAVYLGNTTKKLEFYSYGEGVVQFDLFSTTAMDIGTWYAIKLQRVSGITQLYINGVLEASSAAVTSFSHWSTRMKFRLSYYINSSLKPFTGWLDEIRFLNGTYESSGNYTVSLTPFPDP